jgi:hypothetical protein
MDKFPESNAQFTGIKDCAGKWRGPQKNGVPLFFSADLYYTRQKQAAVGL